MTTRPPLARASFLLAGLLALAACGGGEPADDESLEVGAEAEPAAATEPSLPDTTAEAVWAYLQEQGYREWALWPGASRLYEGTDPHGALLTTYANPAAMETLEAGRTSGFEDGAILVKENHTPDSSLAAVTVMYQAPGYNEANGGWWYLKRNADGTVDAAGAEGTMCQQCHMNAEGDDFVYTSLP